MKECNQNPQYNSNEWDIITFSKSKSDPLLFGILYSEAYETKDFKEYKSVTFSLNELMESIF